MTADPPPPRRRAPRAQWLLPLLLAAAAAALAQPRPGSGRPSAPGTVQVEAAFLLNFIRYTDWPPQRFHDAAAPYLVAVVGGDDTARTVRAVARAAGNIAGRPVAVVQVDADDDLLSTASIARLRAVHAVFVPGADRALRARVLRALADAPVLTVGEGGAFTADGGMLGLLREDDHLVFEANPAAIRAAGVQVSAKVLKLARIEGTRP